MENIENVNTYSGHNLEMTNRKPLRKTLTGNTATSGTPSKNQETPQQRTNGQKNNQNTSVLDKSCPEFFDDSIIIVDPARRKITQVKYDKLIFRKLIF